jgi:hypothetical protein
MVRRLRLKEWASRSRVSQILASQTLDFARFDVASHWGSFIEFARVLCILAVLAGIDAQSS